eukprot:TRINITY_DN67671_c0_g1_i1.p1 TRINITY_DN67671_c0_g1~~TRINITY_DN67671_c0_g1_i1.p1  ORF type:complete len:375 (+),score=60.30 TRINITY_DN67671_c0_g1_i1:37-1125(+)
MAEVDAAAWPGTASVFLGGGRTIAGSHMHKVLLSRQRTFGTSVTRHGSFGCLVLLALQFGLQPLLARRYLPRGSITSVILLSSNFLKILISSLVILLGEPSEQRSKLLSAWTFRDSFLTAGLPSALFAGQGWLLQVGQNNLDSVTFNLLNQTKTLSAALLCYLLLGKRQSLMQCFALLLLFVSAVLLAKQQPSRRSGVEDFDNRSTFYWLGVAPVMAAALSSGLTAALTQRALKGSQGRNSWLYSIELSVWGSCFLIGGTLCNAESRSRLWTQGPYQGWSLCCLLPVFTQAVGGILVGLVTKYSDAVKKGFALISGIVLTTVTQALLEDAPLTERHLAAAVLVAVSTMIHSKFPPEAKAKSE